MQPATPTDPAFPGGLPPGWTGWGPQPFARARAEDRPVLLWVSAFGDAAVARMAEGFARPEIAARLAADFVPVAVDADQRPDVWRWAHAALALFGQQGAPPATLALTPDGSPFWGTTYLPPQDAHGRIGMAPALDGIAAAWRDRRRDCRANAALLDDGLARMAAPRPGVAPADTLARHAAALVAGLDPLYGGFAGVPKVPAVPQGLLLLRGARRGLPGCRAGLEGLLRGIVRGLWDEGSGSFRTHAEGADWGTPAPLATPDSNAAILDLLCHGARLMPELRPVASRVAARFEGAARDDRPRLAPWARRVAAAAEAIALGADAAGTLPVGAFDGLRRDWAARGAAFASPRHLWARRPGSAEPGTLDDQAAGLAAGIRLWSWGGSRDASDQTIQAARALLETFAAPGGGLRFAVPEPGTPDLPVATDLDPGPPSAVATLIGSLVRLALLTGDVAWRAAAERLLAAHAGALDPPEFARAGLAIAADELARGLTAIVLLRPDDEAQGDAALAGAVGAALPPDALPIRIAQGTEVPDSHPAHGLGLRGGRATAHVLRPAATPFVTTDPVELRACLAGL